MHAHELVHSKASRQMCIEVPYNACMARAGGRLLGIAAAMVHSAHQSHCCGTGGGGGGLGDVLMGYDAVVAIPQVPSGSGMSRCRRK